MVEMGEAQAESKPMLAGLHLYLPDADSAYARAMASGGKSLYAVQDMEYRDREGGVADPSGNHWYIGTHKGGGHYAPPGFRTVTAGFRGVGLANFLSFLRKGFGAAQGHAHRRLDGDVEAQDHGLSAANPRPRARQSDPAC